MFCTSCGTRNSDDGNFCKQCGIRLDKPAGTRVSEKAYERALPEDQQITALLERAYRARKEGKREEAIAICYEALAVRPDSTACHSLLGQLHEQGGDHELAIAEYEQVLILNPGSIADRVKLDELRGEVPALISASGVPLEPRTAPHIVVADRSKAPEQPRQPLDFRLPAFAMGAVALVALGGIFTFQLIQHQNANNTGNTARQVGSDTFVPGGPATQLAQQGAPAPNTGQPVAGTQPPPAATPDSTFTGIASGQPIVIQQKAPAGDRVPQIVYQQIPAGTQPPADGSLPNMARGAGSTQRNDAGEPDIKNPGVHISGIGGSLGEPNNASGRGGQPDLKVSPADTPPNRRDVVIVHNGGTEIQSQGSPSDSGAGSGASSESRKHTARADLLAMQGNYKIAGGAYIQALDGAGEDTAYIYRRAAWCFEKAGEKTTALNYYQHGIDEAQKLVRAGKQVETARSLIRACESGIKVCSN